MKQVLILMIIAIFILSACGQKGIKDAKNWPVGDFTYTDQNGQPFGLKDLEGKVWVANFIFTNCVDVCLPMTANMKKLQDLAEKEGIENIQFVSFSVDPTVDSPEVLTEFGKQFNVDFKNWHFLTGYEQKEIENFALTTFKTIVKKPETGDQVLHGTDFYLMDGNGKIMKYYSGLADIPLDDIMKDIKSIQ
ncbi:SCO family protein [Bacillus benzoevorans]|nr:SCO family protein [Bacillus benzoevorans]